MRLLGSLSFRLALLYAALFTGSVLVVAGLYYWVSILRPLEAVESELRAEGGPLMQIYRRAGPETLAPILEKRAGAPSPRLAYHALLRPDGSVVTTNLPSWPGHYSTPWIRIEADVSREGDEDEYEALVLDRMLPDGGRLLIGRDIEDLDELEEAVRDAGVWLLPALLLLVITGGMVMSRAIGRRIDAVGAAAQRVMAGDLSERVPVRGTGDDFDRLSATLNEMLARIEASVESVRRVSDSVAHELRTPLTRLQADLTELEGTLPESGRERLAAAIQEAERLGRMFEAVLRISRIEARSHAAEMRPVDLSTLLFDAGELYQPAAEERALDFTIKVDPGLQVTGDPDLLFQAVGNLLDNAVKFTLVGGRVSLTATRQGSSVRVTVADSGPGVPDDQRARITERFFRAPAAAAVPGFGLGLSLVAAVAARHLSEILFLPGEPGLRVEWRFAAVGPA